MYIDSRLEFSVNQTAADGATSTNTIDLGTDIDLAPGRPMYIVLQTTATQATADSVVSVQTDPAEGGTYSDIASVTVPNGTAAGTRFIVGFPTPNDRFIRLKYSKAGSFTAWLTDQEPSSWTSVPGV